MKRLFYGALLTLITSTSFAQIPDYFSDNPMWHGTNWFSDPPNGEDYRDYYINYLSGEDIFDNKTYHKVWVRGYRRPAYDPPPFKTWNYFTGLYVRQEGRAIYYWDTKENEDSLLVTFDLEIGENLPVGIKCIYDFDTIRRIDSVLVGNEYRRRLFFFMKMDRI